MSNAIVRERIKSAGIFQWQIADQMNISETTLCRMLRKELPDDKREKILEAIEKVRAGM